MRRTLVLACVCVALLAGRCPESESDTAKLPEGVVLLARTAAVKRALEHFMQIEQTPLARWAAGLHQSLPTCPLIEGHAATGSLADLWPTLTCARAATGLDKSLGEHDIAFASVRESQQVLGLVDVVPDGGMAVDVSVPRSFSEGRFGLLLPDSKSAGASVLNGDGTLLHSRIRPSAGLDLASLVSAGSQGAQMFRLKSELFAGVVLDGSVEIAVYLPESGARMPLVALALGFQYRGAAITAMDAFVGELERTWPVARSPFRIGEAEGACLLELRLLPELAPCYVATEEALILGWNPGSLRKSLSGATDSLADLGEFGGMTIDLARFGQADQILSRAFTGPGEPFSVGFPWQRLVATGKPDRNGFRVQVQLQSDRRS